MNEYTSAQLLPVRTNLMLHATFASMCSARAPTGKISLCTQRQPKTILASMKLRTELQNAHEIVRRTSHTALP
jgi:hypothetical protein